MRSFRKLLIIGLFLTVPFIYINSQTDNEEHPIEAKLSKCLDENMSTVESCNCIYEARVAWDQELNKYYKLLMNGLDEPTKVLLRESQRKWIVYRDEEYKFIEGYYLVFKQGTMYSVFAEDRKKEIVKDRAEELRQYYEEIEY